MTISFDKALGVHEQALYLREKRTEVLASNIVNADTPMYKARDFNFTQALDNAMSSQQRQRQNQTDWQISSDINKSVEMLFRMPHQPSLDGNTVEMHMEQAEFAKNNIRHQAALMFVNGAFSGLKAAIRGGAG
ncbi:MAG: flagellar basal body rod protein FlgB [Pseudomonadales bacterium]|nr:flagellar basal body rod protein FlgB [Pseudomonadales bacterium]